ncbi:hypothetical protein C3L33_12688, partial [Rhododendron williamsianum]
MVAVAPPSAAASKKWEKVILTESERFTIRKWAFSILDLTTMIDVVNYTILIDALCKDKNMDHVRDLFNKHSSKGLYPDVKTYNIMIRGFCYKGLLNEAKEFFVEMEWNGCFLDGCTYNVIIRGFKRKKYSEAMALLEEMVAKGFSTNASTAS